MLNVFFNVRDKTCSIGTAVTCDYGASFKIEPAMLDELCRSFQQQNPGTMFYDDFCLFELLEKDKDTIVDWIMMNLELQNVENLEKFKKDSFLR